MISAKKPKLTVSLGEKVAKSSTFHTLSQMGLTDPSLSAYNSKTAEATKIGLVSSERSFPIDIKTCKIFQNSSKNDATVISDFIKKVDLCLG